MLPLSGGYARVVGNFGLIFTQDIGRATYIRYSSDRNVVGLQFNGSSEGTMLDGLPCNNEGTRCDPFGLPHHVPWIHGDASRQGVPTCARHSLLDGLPGMQRPKTEVQFISAHVIMAKRAKP